MFNLFTNLILVGCSDTGLNALPDEPAPETNECGCPDYTDKIAELETKINGLTDQLEHVQGDILDNDERISAVEESSTSSSSLVVTEYDVDCLNQPVKFDYYSPYDGITYPLNYLASGDFGVYNRTAGCVWAKIDPFDPPMLMTNSYFEDMRLDSQGWPNGTDLMANNGNNWFYRTSQGVGNVRVNEDGFVYGGADSSGAPWQRDCSSYTDPDGDCPWSSPLVHVVIFDDKPYDPPSAW